MKALGKPQEKFQRMIEEKKEKKWPEDISLKDYLEHLNVTKRWE
jgi:hypothetical protein